jgi:hypothetical protein
MLRKSTFKSKSYRQSYGSLEAVGSLGDVSTKRLVQSHGQQVPRLVLTRLVGHAGMWTGLRQPTDKPRSGFQDDPTEMTQHLRIAKEKKYHLSSS